MQQRVEIISPARARELLELNNGNRRLRTVVVRSLAQAIKNGEWELTHQGIAIGDNGKLLDGQHRLHAIILADQAVNMLVTTGVPASAFKVIDQGVRRDLVDTLGRSPSLYGLGFLIRVADGGRARPERVDLLRQRLNGIVDRFDKSATGTARSKLTSGPIKAAALYSIIRGESEAYVADAYNLLVQHSDSNLPPVMVAFIRQMLGGKTARGRSGRDYALFMRALPVFAKAHQQDQTIRVGRPEGIDELIAEVKEKVLAIMAGDGL